MSKAVLTPRETRFVEEYMVDACGTQAAIRAGAAPAGAHVWASRALRKAKVSAALQAVQRADSTRLHIKRENVVAALLDAVQTAREQKDPGAMIRGLSELAKMLGFHAPAWKNEAVNPAICDESRQLHSLTDQQLQAMISKGQRRGRLIAG